MSQSHGFSVKQPISIWNKEIEVNFKDLFKSVAKIIVSAKLGKTDTAINSLVDGVAAFKFKEDAGQMAWLLIYRSIARALFMLVEENEALFREVTRGFASLAGEIDFDDEKLNEIEEKINWSIDASELKIDRDFFRRPKGLPIIPELKTLFSSWFKNFGLDKTKALSLGERFPSYFVFALNEEWRAEREKYKLIENEVDTPFTKATQIEESWFRYHAFLQKRIDEPMFQEAFGLRQVYVPLSAYYEREPEKKSDQQTREYGLWREREVEKVVVELDDALDDWLADENRLEGIRILSGGPGFGKSSVAKMFAARQVDKTDRRILFIPLHLVLKLSDNLADIVGAFVKEEGFKHNPLDAENGDERFLIIFDGLDELSSQGKIGAEVAQQFMRMVEQAVLTANNRKAKLKVLICGRDLAVQSSGSQLLTSTKTLHLLPYFLEEEKRKEYIDEKNLLNLDRRDDWWRQYGKLTGENYKQLPYFLQREKPKEYIDKKNLLNPDQGDDWWRQYGKLTGENYKQLPKQLERDDFSEVTGLPLLNYLVALSYRGGRIKFNNDTNINLIYEDLLKSVFTRGGIWADEQHPALRNVKQADFFRVLEEVALTTWHNGGRKVTLREIEEQCSNSGLGLLLGEFKKNAEQGVAGLLVAFYFKKSGFRDVEGNETFEFTHKSFAEYLTARRIVQMAEKIVRERKKRQDDYNDGWDEVTALVEWIKICGRSAMDFYLLGFVRREIALKKSEVLKKWQDIFCELIGFLLKNGTPMEKLVPRLKTFRDDIEQSRNAEESLLALANSCAYTSKQLLNIAFPNNQSLSVWLIKLLQNSKKTEVITPDLLSFLDANMANLRFQFLWGVNLHGAYFQGANLQDTILQNANLQRANLYRANLHRTNLQGAELHHAILEGAILTNANLKRAIFYGAFLENANLQDANLQYANLNHANLDGARLAGANFSGAILVNAIWTNGKRIKGGKYPNLEFQEAD